MASPEQNPKSERKKMIAAIALGGIALITLWYAFFSSSTPKTSTPQTANSNRGTGASRTTSSQGTGDGTTVPLTRASLREEAPPLPPSPIPLEDTPPPAVPEASRNIFAYYVPPIKPTPTPVPPPTPTPAPPPPLVLAAVSPSMVYARTSDFKLDVSGDKFTPQTHIFIDGRELETRYLGPQQLSATVPAAVIASEGARSIIVRTPDGTLYSNNVGLTVAAPPVPNYTYVGLVGGARYNDTAILKDKGSKNLINIQRGDTVNGRFRVTSISQREVVLIDTSLKIKHTLPLTSETGTTGGPQRMPQQPVINDGDDPN